MSTYSTSFSANASQTTNITYTVPSTLPLVPTAGLYCDQAGLWSWSSNVTSLGTATGTGAVPIVTNTTNGTGALALKRVIGNTGITVTDNTNDITISNNGVLSVTNSATGTGAGTLIASSAAGAIGLKHILAGTGTSVTNNSDDILINNTGILSIIDSATGTGTGTLVKGTTSGTTTLKRMKAGTNITLANGTDDVTINSTGIGADSNFYYNSAAKELNLRLGDFNIGSLSLWNGYGLNGVGRVSLKSRGGDAISYTVTLPPNMNNVNTTDNVNMGGNYMLYVSSFDTAAKSIDLDFAQTRTLFRSDSSRNTRFGSGALLSLTVSGAPDNTAFGYNALYSHTYHSTAANTAVGSNSLYSVTTGNQNIGVGVRAGYNLTTGLENIAIGNFALAWCTTNQGNIAIGTKCGYSVNGTGIISDGNTCIGSYCKTTGNGGNVTSVGYYSMRYFDGVNNVAFGSNALLGGVTTGVTGGGLENVAIGTDSMKNVLGTACSKNTCVGFASGLSLNNDVAGTNGTLNCFFGHNTGNAVTTGQTNIIIGADTLGVTTLTNAIIIGYNANQGVSNNEIVIGNINNTVLRNDNDGTCDVGSATKRFNNAYFAGTVNGAAFISPSDERLKTDITDNTLGLEFIQQLRPRAWRYKKEKENVRHRGFIAQEVLNTLTEAQINNFTELVTFDDQTGLYSLNQLELIAPLVNTCQQLIERIKQLELQVNNLINKK